MDDQIISGQKLVRFIRREIIASWIKMWFAVAWKIFGGWVRFHLFLDVKILNSHPYKRFL
jgi:hypothetical protein